jgi:hypothetical protein
VELEGEDPVLLGSEFREDESTVGLEEAAIPIADADSVESFPLRVRGGEADRVGKPEQGRRVVLATSRGHPGSGRQVGP